MKGKSIVDIISVIVPVYNSESFLDRCINSILHQKYTAYELLLVDDGSTDNSKDIIRKWTSKDNRIIPIFQQNSGASSARNHGLDVARGKWVVFIDSDDVVSTDYLNDLYESTNVDNDIELCVDGVAVFRRNKWTENRGFPNLICNLSDVNKLFLELTLHKSGFSVGKLYRRSIIENNSLRFNTKVCIAEDMMFMVQYILAASQNKHSKIAFIDKCNYCYYIHQESLSTSVSHFDNEFYSYKEYVRIIRLLKAKFAENDSKVDFILFSPTAYYVDRCINAIFQRPISQDWEKKLEMLDRVEYQKYKKCNSLFEFLLKFLFVHHYWYFLRLLR